MKKALLFIVIVIFSLESKAQNTWSNSIAPLIYGKCSSCHNANGIAPFALMSYYDATDNASDILSAVQSHKMPPWPPNSNYNRLAHERVLSVQEISAIANWVSSGTPRGDSTLEPTAPVFSGLSQITNPDLILSAPVYNVNTTTDLYRCFVIPTISGVQQYITGMEAIPGDRNIVHHILIFSDTSSTPAQLDAADPGPGYTNFGGTGSNSSKLIGVWVPGQSAYFTPTNMGINIPANANIILQIHYPGGISSKVDSTKLFLKLSTAWHREIFIDSPLNHYQLDNGPLIIAPNITKTFTAHYTIPYDLTTLSVGPHMHLLGKNIRSYGVTPTNDTIPFIDIPNWDFHWQGLYSFPKLIKLPAGTTLYSSALYDNTTANPNNPNSPPAWVFLGESTTDEMMLIYFSYTLYFPGDENIIIDSNVVTGLNQPMFNSAISTVQLYDPVPNPAVDQISIQYFLPVNEKYNLKLIDFSGKIIRELKNETGQGIITSQFNIQDLATGTYFISLTSNGVQRTKKVIKE